MSETKLKLPLVPLRAQIAFPTTVLTFDVMRPRVVGAIETAMSGDKQVFAVAQRDASVDSPGIENIYNMGTVIALKQLIRLPDGTVRVFAEGVCRALLVDVIEEPSAQYANVYTVDEAQSLADDSMLPVMRLIKKRAAELARLREMNGAPKLGKVIRAEKSPEALCDLVSANLLDEMTDKQAVLECVDISLRLDNLLQLITRELSLTRLEIELNNRVRVRMEKANRDYFLREQINVIRDELGESDEDDIAELRERLAKSPISGEPRDKAEKELKRLARVSTHAPEGGVSYNYIERLLSIPWDKTASKKIDIAYARKVLESDHYGLEDVKSRLIEYLGVLALNPEAKSPIICLIGPPGVGKTSIARSIARAMKRSFAQMSLGGVRDEAELRGHRRTYIGAMPGRVITAIEHCGSMNPVFLLDEVDKLTRDMHGDPASALLEILDPEQNSRFRDNYIDAPVDLSGVMFITTANNADTIDRALLDRMEIIDVPSYTLEEKVQIAKLHLLPKQLKANGLRKSQLRMSEDAFTRVADGYTREAGVRELERTLAKICRKAALRLSEDESVKSVSLKPDSIEKYLGSPRYTRQSVERLPSVGVVNGLAWTSVGGEVMPVEALTLDGSGALEMTGKLGEVMKESAKLALSVARLRLSRYGVNADYFKSHDIHVHVPEGAVPKDGPSAGVAISCAVFSAITGERARADIAMTGEITLTGRVLPIGGVKEKLLAAYRMGIKRILLPRENAKDLEELDAHTRESMEITLIDTVEDALGIVLINKAPIERAV